MDAIERAAVVVDFALNCWRALPEQGSLGLSWRHKVLDEGVEKLRVWVEDAGGEATRRELQRAHVAGVRAASDLDALLERYEDTYANCVVEVVPGARRVAHEGGPAPPPDGPGARTSVATGDSGGGSGRTTASRRARRHRRRWRQWHWRQRWWRHCRTGRCRRLPGGDGKRCSVRELLAETHRLVIRAEAAFVRARARSRCSVCGSEKAEPFVRAGVTYYRCGHSEVLLLAAGASQDLMPTYEPALMPKEAALRGFPWAFR